MVLVSDQTRVFHELCRDHNDLILAHLISLESGLSQADSGRGIIEEAHKTGLRSQTDCGPVCEKHQSCSHFPALSGKESVHLPAVLGPTS